jgi:hypothetical protein
VAVAMISGGKARAHDLVISWSVHDVEFRVSVRFDSDDPAEDCAVTLLDDAGRIVQKRMTDANGIVTFAKPESGRYQILADAGAGHVKRVTVEMDRREIAESKNISISKLLNVVIGLGLITTITMIVMQLRRKRTRP